ncbi:glycosyltransferase [Candidatus Dojkabacteria bacterium]|nr:glycosyltransferase [Candidatus Dojkabacteria bacterium]
MKKSITFVTQADLLGKKNSLTKIAKTIINALNPDQIICRDLPYKKPKKYSEIIPGGGAFFKILTGLNTLLGINDSQIHLTTRLLSFFLSRKKIKTDLLFLHYSAFKEVIEKNRDKTIVGFATSVNSKRILEILRQEYGRFGLDYPVRYYYYFQESLLQCDYIFAWSEFARKELVSEGFPNERIFVIGNAVDTERFVPKPSKKTKKFTALCVADFDLNKGVQYLIEVWKELALEDAELVLIGHKTRAVRKIIRDAKCSTILSISHCNPIPHYQKSTVFVLPSLAEGAARVIYEAMSCELPIIATENAGGPVANEKSGFVGPIQDKVFLKKSILEYYQNRKLVYNHGHQARKKVLEYDFSKFEARLRRGLAEILYNEK